MHVPCLKVYPGLNLLFLQLLSFPSHHPTHTAVPGSQAKQHFLSRPRPFLVVKKKLSLDICMGFSFLISGCLLNSSNWRRLFGHLYKIAVHILAFLPSLSLLSVLYLHIYIRVCVFFYICIYFISMSIWSVSLSICLSIYLFNLWYCLSLVSLQVEYNLHEDKELCLCLFYSWLNPQN